MFCYMINTNPLGEYYRAFEQARQTFRDKDPLLMAKNSGVEYNHLEKVFLLTSMGQEVQVSYPDGEVFFVEKNLPPIWEWQLIIINYLARASGEPISGQPVSYRELDGGNVFYPAFKKHCIDRISTELGRQKPAKIAAAIRDLSGQVQTGDKLTANFAFLPRFPVTVHLWPADEELPASANILFDSSANNYLHTEDIAALGSIIADFMCAQYYISE